MNMLRTGLLTGLLALSVLTAGCITTGKRSMAEATPEQALAYQLAALRTASDFTSGCRPESPLEPGVTDCLRHVRALD